MSYRSLRDVHALFRRRNLVPRRDGITSRGLALLPPRTNLAIPLWIVCLLRRISLLSKVHDICPSKQHRFLLRSIGFHRLRTDIKRRPSHRCYQSTITLKPRDIPMFRQSETIRWSCRRRMGGLTSITIRRCQNYLFLPFAIIFNIQVHLADMTLFRGNSNICITDLISRNRR